MEPKDLRELESNGKDALTTTLKLQQDPKYSLTAKTLLQKLKDTINEILLFTNEVLLSNVKRGHKDIQEKMEDMSTKSSDPTLKVHFTIRN